MPIPLLWLGAGLAAAYASGAVTKNHRSTSVGLYPGEGNQLVSPVNGAVVCCGIYGVFEHTGIWVEDKIIELKGNGLIRAVSPERFTDNRSGNTIFIACDHSDKPLIAPQSAERAIANIFTYSEYDVLKNNCHKFVYNCISGQVRSVTSFNDLNGALAQFFATRLCWQPSKM